MEWSDQVEAANWWASRLRPFRDHVVGSLVPAGFDAITRIFHPVNDDENETLHKWSDLAAANGRIAHAEMQLHRIVSKPGENRDFQDVPWVDMGYLPTLERRRLADLLFDAGSTGPVWFGFSDIDSTFHCEANANLPKADTPSREYFLIAGTLATIDDVSRFACSAAEDWQVCSPSIWWPEDRSWFVISEFDFMWTYVAGSESLIASIETSPHFEALRSDYNHEGHADADRVNQP